MRFQNMTIYKEINQAIDLAEKLLDPESEMLRELSFKNDLKFNSGTGFQAARTLALGKIPAVKVYTYKPKIPWSKAIGGLKNGYIQINSRKLPFLTTVDIAANLVHEYAHYCGFSHGNNFKTEEKCLYSVPYYLSENIKKWI